MQRKLATASVHERLVHWYLLAAGLGILLIVAGASLGILAGHWLAAIPLLLIGVIALAGGLWARRSLMGTLTHLQTSDIDGATTVREVTFPTVERLIRMFTWVAIVGALAMGMGLILGIVAQQWAVASALVPAGAVALAVGAWESRRGRRMIDARRKIR